MARRTLVLAAGVGAAVVVAMPGAGLAPGAGQTSGLTSGPSLRAVVTLSGARAVATQGVAVLAHYGHVGVEVVSGTPAALRALAHAPGVAGVTPDTAVQLDSKKTSGGGGYAVFSWQGLGGNAGQPRAGAGVTVAVLDTGVSDTPALNRASGRLVDGVDTSALANGGEARTSGQFTDGFGHGTFMANLIAGGHVKGVPGRHGVGVAPQARVVVVKVADNHGQTALSDVLAGMDWVATQAPKIQVVSIALSHDRPNAGYGADPLTAGIEHLRAFGVLPVVASGNTAGQVGDPGFTPKGITVGAADLANSGRTKVADFSGYGNVDGVSKPDFVASGVDVYSYLPGGSVIGRKHTHRVDGLNRGSGTSESTAITAGAIADLLSANPDARLVDVKGALRVSADRLGSATGQGQGLLDLDKAGTVLARGLRHGGDPNGEAGLDTQAWNANAWLGGSWQEELAGDWSANSWAASSWAGNSWSANSWGSNSWDANSWAANSWAANSWQANSWSASSWAANSWAANSWAANSWSASSWDASSWAAQDWGERR